MRAAVNANYFLRTCEMHSLGKSSHAAEGGTLTQQLSFSAFLGLRLADARVNTTLAGFSEFRFRGSELFQVPIRSESGTQLMSQLGSVLDSLSQCFPDLQLDLVAREPNSSRHHCQCLSPQERKNLEPPAL